jgi:RES domain-containing protein
VIVYRLVSSRYPASEGLGASLYGGRWNHKGTPVIYTSGTVALCALVVLVNADELAGDYFVTTIEVPAYIAIATISLDELPPTRNARAPTDVTRDLGTAWATALVTAVLSVPSVVIPRERNYLLNPAHPDFARIQFGNPEPFYFDDRLGRSPR